METGIKKLYEAMFLVDSAEAASDWEGINTLIKTILERAEAEIVSIRKWDDRKLAYAIGGKARGTYILCHFKAEGRRISEIERDVRLSERIMRVLILTAEHLSREDIEKETPAMFAEKQGSQSPPDTTVRQAEGEVADTNSIEEPEIIVETEPTSGN